MDRRIWCVVVIAGCSGGGGSADAPPLPIDSVATVDATTADAGVCPEGAAVSGPEAGRHALAVAAGDLDGDGAMDLAVGAYADSAVQVLLGRGDGTFESAVAYATQGGPHHVAIADVDGDADLDLIAIAVINQLATVSLLLGNGDGTYAPRVTYPVGDFSFSTAVADLDADSAVDLIVPIENTLQVFRGNGDGTFQAPYSVMTGYGPRYLSVVDLDGDDDLDIAATMDFGISVSLNAGDGTFPSLTNVASAPGAEPWAIATPDLDGDGDRDLVVSDFHRDSPEPTIAVLLNNSDGTFAPVVAYPTADFPSAMVTGDYNADGRADLAIAHLDEGTVTIMLGNGDGTLQAEVSYGSNAENPWSIAQGQLDGRCGTDLVLAHDNGGVIPIRLLVGRGDGTFL